MEGAQGNMVEPVFVEGSAGRLFAVYHPPAIETADTRDVIYVPPFAEEMNRSRRMATLQAKSLAAIGIGVLIIDLFGTGDSAGDFRDAQWRIWLGDILSAADWLERRSHRRLALWGLRLGALLATAVASRECGRFMHLVLWQPVTDGHVMLTQFLRVRVAASMTEGRGQETTDGLRAELAAGRPVEIAGYELSPELAKGIEAARMDGCALPPGVRVDWLEVGSAAGDTISPAGRRVVETWRASGIEVSAVTVPGQQFWTLQETTLAPDLLAATRRIFE
jgi:exosortase A-associated hydrolase 2